MADKVPETATLSTESPRVVVREEEVDWKRSYHFRTKIHKQASQSAVRLVELETRLAAVGGVESAFVHTYDVTIHKAHLYEWDEIDPKVIRILETFLAAK